MPLSGIGPAVAGERIPGGISLWGVRPSLASGRFRAALRSLGLRLAATGPRIGIGAATTGERTPMPPCKPRCVPARTEGGPALPGRAQVAGLYVVAMLGLAVLLSGCGAAYVSPSVRAGEAAGLAVEVVPLTAGAIAGANRSAYEPRGLPGAFHATAGAGGAPRGGGALPEAPLAGLGSGPMPQTRLPPPLPDAPYRIGIGDVIALDGPAGPAPEGLPSVVAGQTRRQVFAVQDDGAVAIPDVGRVPVAGLTLPEAEARLLERLVDRQIQPSVSVAIAEFNAQRVSIGGAVRAPAVLPVGLAPLYLDEAVARAGGALAEDPDRALVQLYRDGALYQMPLSTIHDRPGGERLRLAGGDSVFIDTSRDLDLAQKHFAEQIRLAEMRQSARRAALEELQAEVALRRAELEEARANYRARQEFGAEGRDHVYLTGEVARPRRFPLPLEGARAMLADALYDGGGSPAETGNPAQIYLLRGTGSGPGGVPTGVTAYHLDARNAAALILATRMELRPDDVIFVAEQPITRWNRVLRQFVPSLIATGVSAADN